MAFFKKTKDGDWMIASSDELTVGSIVSIKKKDGSETKVKIKKKAEDLENLKLYEFEDTNKNRARGRTRIYYGAWRCYVCGEHNEASSSSCWECGWNR